MLVEGIALAAYTSIFTWDYNVQSGPQIFARWLEA